jgi:hypothetical protein
MRVKDWFLWLFAEDNDWMPATTAWERVVGIFLFRFPPIALLVLAPAIIAIGLLFNPWWWLLLPLLGGISLAALATVQRVVGMVRRKEDWLMLAAMFCLLAGLLIPAIHRLWDPKPIPFWPPSRSSPSDLPQGAD